MSDNTNTKGELAVVHWFEEFKQTILPLESVPPDARYEGALTNIKWLDGVEYKARIVKVSGDMAVINEADRELMKKNAALHAKQESVIQNQKRTRRSTKLEGKASERAVAKAVGERPKFTKAQEEAKKLARKVQKDKEEKQRNAERSKDLSLLKNKTIVKSSCSSSCVNDEVRPSTSKSIIIARRSDSDETDDDDIVLSDSEQHVSKRPALHLDSKSSRNVEGFKDNSETSSITDRIMDLKNPNTVSFLRTLMELFSGSEQASEFTLAESDQEKFAQPVIRDGDGKAYLREGHMLQISKSLKAKLILKSKTSLKNPVRLLKRTLDYLYGKEQLKRMTARGTKSYIGISDKDLLAIYAFLNKHAEWMLDFDDMVKEITRKCVQVRSGLDDADDDISAPNTPSEKASTGNADPLLPHAADADASNPTPTSVLQPTTPVKSGSTGAAKGPNDVTVSSPGWRVSNPGFIFAESATAPPSASATASPSASATAPPSASATAPPSVAPVAAPAPELIATSPWKVHPLHPHPPDAARKQLEFQFSTFYSNQPYPTNPTQYPQYPQNTQSPYPSNPPSHYQYPSQYSTYSYSQDSAHNNPYSQKSNYGQAWQ